MYIHIHISVGRPEQIGDKRRCTGKSQSTGPPHLCMCVERYIDTDICVYSNVILWAKQEFAHSAAKLVESSRQP